MKINLKPIHNQVVVLVGATSGIGLETAKLFAEKGARVAIVGRSQEGLNEALERVRMHTENHRMMQMGSLYGYGYTSEMTQSPGAYADIEAGRPTMSDTPMGETSLGSTAVGGAPIREARTSALENQIIALEGDITSFDQMRSVADQVIQRFGRIDTWVNVAGIGEWALFEDTSPDEFRRIIEVNLIGHANGAMAALPYLRQQRGSALVFVSSIAGRVPVPYQAAYSASKHGLNGMIETLRMELKHTGAAVSVTNIMPTSMNTPLFEKARTKLGVEPDPIPPVYDNTMVAKAIAHASTHPVRELIVGDAGILMNFIHRLSPGLATKYMSATGFRSQRSDEFKSAQAPDNLYEHLSGYNRVQGDLPEMHFAPMTWLSTHPRARMAIFGGLLALAAGLIGLRVYKGVQHRRTLRYRLPRQMRQMYNQAGVSARHAGKSMGKTLSKAGHRIERMPVVSELPMFHRPSLWERIGNTLTGFWAGALAILPFTRRKKFIRRFTEGVADRLPEVHMPEIHAPWKREKSFTERITLADQRKVAARKLGKTTDRMREKIVETRKDAAKAVDKAAARGKDVVSKAPFVERRESLIERVTFKK